MTFQSYSKEMNKWDINTTKVKVNEIYKSFQGEGVNSGCECIFLRLSTCNLHCGFCDTPYTWDWKNYDFQKETKVYTIPELAHKIRMFKIRHIVVTGGEPMLQQNQLYLLFKELTSYHRQYYIEVETNGTIKPIFEFGMMVDRFNVSPKTANSGNDNEYLDKVYKDTLLEYDAFPNTTFKFVVNNREDINEIIDKFNCLVSSSKIMLMPEGRTAQEIIEKEGWLKECCQLYGFKYTTRLHILKYGNQRGV